METDLIKWSQRYSEMVLPIHEAKQPNTHTNKRKKSRLVRWQAEKNDC